MSIIFAVPRHDYASYRDLYALIDLSGFDKVFIDQINPASANAYIITIFNDEVPRGGYPDARARIVLLDLEWHVGDNALPPLPNVEIWAGDKWYAQQIGARYVPLGSHPSLRPNTDSTWHERYDVAFIGYIIGVARRERFRQQLIERGVKVSPTGAWGDERHRVLSNSAAYLHVHQHDHVPTIAPLRMVVAAAYGLPVISESVADAGIFQRLTLEDNYHSLAETVGISFAVAPGEQFNGFGQALHQLLCHDLTFRKSIEAAL